MSKGLEALKEIAIQSVEALIGKQEPLRTQKINELLETKQFKCIEKELKALEIIKEKDTDIGWLKNAEDLCQYNNGMGVNSYSALTQEEYDLLKEELEK